MADVDELVPLLARVSVRLGVLGLPAEAPQLRAGLTAGEAGLAALVELAAALNNADSLAGDVEVMSLTGRALAVADVAERYGVDATT